MNGRLYDPLVARFLNVDPYVQLPDYTQNLNRYSYCLNNPLKYSDESGEFIFTILAAVFCPPLLPYAVAADISWMTDYAIQVGMNYANGYKGSDAWLKKIDWFDVGTSAVVGGLTGGYSAELKAGKEIGKFGAWVVKNRKLITLGEMAVTSAIDITGEGWQPIGFDDFTKRFSINLATFGLTELASDYTKKLVKGPEVETTKHGAERIAGPGATRGGVLSKDEIIQTNMFGKKVTQADGAIVKIHEVGGRFNITITGDRGLITTFKNLSQESLNRLSKRYGWQ